MARQSTAPVSFNRSVRPDEGVTMSSARAGVVVPLCFIPLHAMDSCAGKVGIDVRLKEMPKPVLNGVTANFQAWFVPKSSHPQFPGRDELLHARTGAAIKALGAADRTPPPFFTTLSGATVTTAAASDFFKVLGLHVPTGASINSDLIDAFSVIYNFRLAAHSSRLALRAYASEDIAEATSLPPAFWPSSRLSQIVPDYEQALITGAFDLDVAAGTLSVSGDGTVRVKAGSSGRVGTLRKRTDGIAPNLSSLQVNTGGIMASGTGSAENTVNAQKFFYDPDGGLEVDLSLLSIANSGGAGISVTLADIDKARTTQAFAKLRTAYAGNDTTGFANDDTIVAHVMSGLSVPSDAFKRPWLLDSKRVPVGMSERFATDGASLDASVTLGRASAVLSLNVPLQDVSGVIIVTCEVLPERVDERMSDEWLLCTAVADLPDALRDVQRTEPVDMVFNRRIDAKHTTPAGLYGYEPMNAKWRRSFTRCGGDFYMATPGGGWTENRSNIWQTEIVNPAFTSTHYLAPVPFPHDVFADTEADAFEFVCRHSVAISGLTQIGDPLVEDSGDYEAVEDAGA